MVKTYIFLHNYWHPTNIGKFVPWMSNAMSEGCFCVHTKTWCLLPIVVFISDAFLPLWNLSILWCTFLFIPIQSSPYCANILMRVVFSPPLIIRIKWQHIYQQWCHSTTQPSCLPLDLVQYVSCTWVPAELHFTYKF